MVIRIVFCYAREDEKLLEQLKAHLKPLEREQFIEMWYDRNISAGAEWQGKISEKLDSADMILLLISSDFMNSDYCYSVEMQRALELRKQGKACVIPIILRPVFWKTEPLYELQSLPTDGDPVTDTQRWKSIDEALFHVTQGICLVLQQLAAQPTTPESLKPDLLQKVLEKHDLLIKKEEPTREKYRIALHRDPRIAKVQVMNMSRPLDITSIYVRLRIHEEVSQGLELHPTLQMAGKLRDPNILLEKKRELLKTRAAQALEPDAAIRKHSHCVIVGDPGSGKTTLLKYLTLKSVDGALADLPALPIYIELNAFVNSKNTHLLEFAAATWDERYGFSKDQALIFMQNELAAGRAMLLLDALDETVIGESSQDAEASYKRVADSITSMATRYHLAPIVVTARKAGYQLREPLAGFNELEILDFSLDDMKRFITNWFSSTPTLESSNKAAHLITRLERALRIQELATNPLLLSLIVLVYESQLDLPERRAELYKRCIEILLTDWDSKRHIVRRREFQPLHKRLLLEEIAWHFHQRGSRYFSERELLGVIARFLPAIGLQPEHNKRILQEIATENGILKEQAQGWYGFIHMTLQEYCAAQYLTDHNELETLMHYVDDPRWEEVVLLYAGQVPDASQLLERLLGKAAGSPSDDIFRNNLIMAGRCLAARPTIRHVALREEILSSLFTLLRTTNHSLTRSQVIETLLRLGDAKVNKRLLDLLNDERLPRSDLIRMLVVRLGKQMLEPDLLAMLKNERCAPDLRCELIKSISWEAFELALPELLLMLKNEQCPLDLRCELIARIFRSPRRTPEIRRAFELAFPDLLSLLKDNQCNPSVRVAIVNACKNIIYYPDKITLVKAELWDLLRSEPHITIVYKRARIALRFLWEEVSASEVLLFLSNEQDISYAREMCQILESLEDNTVIPGLLQILKNGQASHDIRREVIRVIHSLGNTGVVPELLNLLKDEQLDFYLRAEIGSILVRNSALAMSTLLSLLRDKRLSVYAGLLSLQEINFLGSEWGEVDLEAEEEEIAAEIISVLLNLLKDKKLDASLRNDIVLNLPARHLPPGTTQKLLSILKNEPGGTLVYNSLVLTIATNKETSVLQHVLRLLKARRYPPDFKAFDYIVEMLQDQKLVPDLLYLLTDRRHPSELRKAVAGVLESLIDDDETTAQLAKYIPRLYIDENIYASLWRLSRRTGVKILV